MFQINVVIGKEPPLHKLLIHRIELNLKHANIRNWMMLPTDRTK